ncbi:MraY family glycosyltransferase [Brevibacterium antiquum]|uniref:UDP-N-acetylmuramyl pentapeptide phosphotransferase/UDP-N-acetylglucosamine-1-phosphate transferase n=1 Tax=Brevibacterium antiquum TaxID=234835 RepID=A0A2H1KMX8_9MICO|nr:glycosyltransferase family 4 protein [Brevibacterium antiquum]SMY00979.1 UDP-N-acetylmuramyl pentapeptide phosphotransferase/UDP-N-acetylglucosamine-1-phosphate transferase [Brevibacterium antiquum]
MALQSLVILVVAAVVTVLSALIAFPLLRRAGVVDIPSHRSSHTLSTVRGGGIAIGCGITVATILAMVWTVSEDGVFGLGGILLPVGFLVLTWCYSAIGMSDDLDSLRPAGRLIGQVILALLFSAIIAMFSTQGIAHVIAFAVIGVTTVNAVNFVDGLNGYVTEWTIVTAGWFAFVSSWEGENDIALLALALAGAAVGFLPFNLGRAKAFLGDTGSYGIGAAVFALAVWLFVQGVPIVVIIAPMIFVLFDVGLTLVLRLFRGEDILLPHREHIYQRIQQAGWPHSSVSLFHTALSVLACVMAVPTLISGNTATTYPAHVFWVGLLAFYALLPLWLRRRAQKEAMTA